MNELFEPYQQWLGIRHKDPNYYQLIGVPDFEADLDKIRVAVDRAIAGVRSHRPGPHAAQWAELLDLLKRVKTELCNPTFKQAYDAALRRNGSAAQAAAAARQRATRPAESNPGLRPQAGSSPAPAKLNPGAAIGVLPADDAHLDPMAPVDPNQLGPTTQNAPSASQVGVSGGVSQGGGIQTSAAAPLVRAAKRRPQRSRTPALLLGSLCLCILVAVAGFAFREELGLVAPSQVAQGNPPPSNNGSAGVADPAVAKVVPSATPGNTEGTPRTNVTPAITDDLAETPSESPAELTEPDGGESISGEPDGQMEAEPVEGTPNEPNTTAEMPDENSPASLTAEERQQLSKVLVSARTALQQYDFAATEQHLTQAKPLARNEEHQAMVRRLQQAAEHMRGYREAVARAMQVLEAGSTLEIGPDVIVAVVERKPDAIVVKVAGRNQTYPLDQLPLKLGLALAEQGLQGSSKAPLIKGTFQALHPRATAEHLAEVRAWWEEAGERGAELIPLLEDDYQAIAPQTPQ